MSRYESMMKRVRAGERILIDGATGTEVERRGVPQLDNAWNGGGALSHPDIVRQVHEDYIGNGAEIVISNTFATSWHALRDAGVEGQFEDYNRRGVELAVEARNNKGKPDVLVAGGISYWSWTGEHPSLDVLRVNIEQQATVMRDAGADLLMLEMMVGLDRLIVTLEAAQNSGLPVWVGLTCKPDQSGAMRLWDGDLLTDVLAEMTKRNVPLINIMHTEVEYIDACLDILKDHWTGPMGVYAHSGGYADGKWLFDDTISPQEYCTNAKGWLQRGVQVIGGCCGIRVDHIAELQKAV